VTAILPRPADTSAGPTTDQLRVENTNLRAMVTALVDRNYAEHPRTAEQLAVIAADARHRYEVLALHAIPAKETP
jgi:hypothetical protein